MIEPVALDDFFVNVFSAATIILAGASYAALFAWGKLTRRPGFLILAYVSYGVLAVSVWLLAETSHFEGFWRIIAGLMLIGYFAAPQAIWRLCTATHAGEHSEHDRPIINQQQEGEQS
ncbi:hypothetical protein [Methylocaldum gracile]|jgi:hypothetical protein|uniref:hypothetical protein n=1 Tax=unclassified Methylocaldum TaxID=2622260 RepID=UPI00105D46A2